MNIIPILNLVAEARKVAQGELISISPATCLAVEQAMTEDLSRNEDWRFWETQFKQLGGDPMKLLERLTPGGSEFHKDPIRCALFIKDSISSMWEVNKRLMGRLNEIKNENSLPR